MQATAPPRSSTCAISAVACLSNSSVSHSTKYDPPRGSTVLVTPISSPMICCVRTAMRCAFSVGMDSASS